jgi:hypothetical protein
MPSSATVETQAASILGDASLRKGVAEMEITAAVIVPGAGKLAYRVVGAGPPLILLHDSPGDGRSWSRLVPRLAQHHRVIVSDLPGHGGSDPLRVNTIERTAAMGAVIGVLIDGYGETIRLCGHSYGGNVAPARGHHTTKRRNTCAI